ncbi:hypothetical protein J5A71_01295 [Prevotella melaninogenica]|uniref:hypothetical protein n=1 Tax=Prevotella melaninogenica TaxID=28132 RepID=UPI001BAA7BED|nr:hypothetical protein [Prevotella melaninogenica]QUB55994.1 hypothetical protein J5A72_06805 [Prevotella melaninogenica]QUB58594.1 hypothetical protein J5A71_01295 [Prevotella melaninogenica]
MKHIVALLITLCLLSIETKAQQTLSFPDVDAIGYSDNPYDIVLYTAVGPNKYCKRILTTDSKSAFVEKGSEMNIDYWKALKEKDIMTKEEILAQKNNFLKVSDIPSTSLNDYIGKIFFINEDGAWRREGQGTSLILKFIQHNTASIQEVYYGTERDQYNQKVTSISLPEKKEMWRIDRATHYTPLILKFKDNKQIIVLKSTWGGSFNYLLIPGSKKDILINRSSSYPAAELKEETEKYAETKPYDFTQYFIKRYYGLRKTENNKVQLINRLGENVLGEDYDHISYADRFIIAQTKDKIDVFNLYLNKLNLGKIKVAREVPRSVYGRIEVLNDEGAAYYDEFQQKASKPIRRILGVCGTVSHWSYDIVNEKGVYMMQKTSTGPGWGYQEKVKFILTDCQPGDSVSIINGSKKFSYNANYGINGEIAINPSLIKVGRNGKFGILRYDYHLDKNIQPQIVANKPDNYPLELHYYPTQKVKGEILLPIENDSIVMQQDGMILFYKDGKIGIFGRDKTPVFEELTQQTKSFYYFRKDGKEGWIDRETGTEYFKE